MKWLSVKRDVWKSGGMYMRMEMINIWIKETINLERWILCDNAGVEGCAKMFIEERIFYLVFMLICYRPDYMCVVNVWVLENLMITLMLLVL